MKTDFRWEPPHPPNAQKVLMGNFPQLSTESCECERSRTVRQKVPHPTCCKFPSSCRMLLQQRIQRFSIFCTVSTTFRKTFRIKNFPHKFFAGFSAGFSKLPLDFPQGFHADARRELLPKSLRIQSLWLGLKEGEHYEDPVPCRNWSDKPFVNRCSQTE